MKYIFKGKVIEKKYLIWDFLIKSRVEMESRDTFDPSGHMTLYYPDVHTRTSKYYEVCDLVVEKKTFHESNLIEYKIEEQSVVRIDDETYVVERVEINDNGTVTCYTNKVIECIENEKDINWAKSEVIRIYEELKNQNKCKDNEQIPEERPRKGFWSRLFRLILSP